MVNLDWKVVVNLTVFSILPDPRSNYHTFSGELYNVNNSTNDNTCIISFETERKKVKVKKGEPGYYARPVFTKDKI